MERNHWPFVKSHSWLCVWPLLLFTVVSTAMGSDAGRLSRIIETSLDFDGSLTPPGDALTVTAVVAPGALQAHLEVRAYLITGNDNEEQQAVRGKTAMYRSEAGAFLARSNLLAKGLPLKPDGKAATFPEGKQDAGRAIGFRRSVVIPYEELLVPKGEHRLGYAMSLIVDGEVVDFTTLALNSLSITDGVRAVINRPINRETVETITEKKDVLVMTADGLELRTIDAPSQKTRAFTSMTEQRTNIPGEYNREPIHAQGDPAQSPRAFVEAGKRPIYFATNRNEIGRNQQAASRFGNRSIAPDDPLAFGVYAVSVPLAVHERGRVEQPKRSWWFWKEKPDEQKHFVILDEDALSTKSLSAEELIGRFGDKDILVYVHGFNNSFEDALVRAAQLQHDLRFPGNMMAFSWPSEARLLFSADFNFVKPDHVLAYDADREKAKQSAPFLAKALELLLAGGTRAQPAGKVHVIAHSMGNFVLLNALAKLNLAENSQAHPSRRLGEVILAAPDVTDGEFNKLHPALFRSSDRVTLYSSADDVALRVSKRKKSEQPIGIYELTDPLNPLDTISANGAFNSFYDDGHSYFGNTIAVLVDISFLVNLRKPPLERRPPLGARVEAPALDGSFYWTIAPEWLP